MRYDKKSRRQTAVFDLCIWYNKAFTSAALDGIKVWAGSTSPDAALSVAMAGTLRRLLANWKLCPKKKCISIKWVISGFTGCLMLYVHVIYVSSAVFGSYLRPDLVPVNPSYYGGSSMGTISNSSVFVNVDDQTEERYDL